MAHATPAEAGHPDMDYAEHERTYRRFLTLSKWAVVHIVVLLILLAWLFL
jgi:hypothetical protein